MPKKDNSTNKYKAPDFTVVTEEWIEQQIKKGLVKNRTELAILINRDKAYFYKTKKGLKKSQITQASVYYLIKYREALKKLEELERKEHYDNRGNKKGSKREIR